MAEAAAVTCESRETLIALLVEGDLDPAEHAALESHLGRCERCREFAEEMAASQESLKSLANEELAPGSLAEVRYRVRASLDRPRRSLVPVWAMTAAAAVGILALLVLRRTEPTAPPPDPVAESQATEAPTAAATAVASLAPSSISPVDRAPAPSVAREAVRRSPSARRTVPLKPPLAVAPHPGAPDDQSAVVKLKTSDPDVVIYWVDDSNGGQS